MPALCMVVRLLPHHAAQAVGDPSSQPVFSLSEEEGTLNSERKSFAAFALTAALLLSTVPMLVAAPLATTASAAAYPASSGRAHVSSLGKAVGPAVNLTINPTLSPTSGTRGTTVTVSGGNAQLTGPVTITLRD